MSATLASEVSQNGNRSKRSNLVLFIHGWFGKSNSKTWARFPELIASDPDLAEAYDVEYFGYDTPATVLGARQPITKISEHLHTRIVTEWWHYKEIVVIAHNQGGQVIRRYVADRLLAKDEYPVKRVLYFAPPHLDVTVDARKVPGVYSIGPPRELGFGSDDLRALFKDEAETGAASRIRTKFIVAGGDKDVNPMSAWGQNGPGDYLIVSGYSHSAIIKPEDATHPGFEIARDFILTEHADPAAYENFELEPPLLEIRARDSQASSETRECEHLVDRARDIPFFGRDDELRVIDDFLEDGHMPFSWMLLRCPGGAGKSRLVLKVVLAQQSGGWHAGFLQEEQLKRDWSRWQPVLPTLLVVDYVLRDPSRIKNILSNLTDREPGNLLRHPVRLLLLERDDSRYWYELIHDTFTQIDQQITRTPDLELRRLSDLWPIFEHVWSSLPEDQRAALPEKEETLAQLGEIDGRQRALFAYLMAEALARKGEAHHRDRDALLSSVLEYERENWAATAKQVNLDNGIVAEQWMLALATMVGELPIDFLKTNENDIFPRWQQRGHPDLLGVMTGGDARTVVRKLEPDILGEFFVLSLLETSFAKAKELVSLAWEHFPLGTALFVDRCRVEFLEHPGCALAYNVRLSNPKSRRYWAQVAFNLIFDLRYRNISVAQSRYRELEALAKAHPEESNIRFEQAKAAFCLIRYMWQQDMAAALSLYRGLEALSRAYPDESEIRLEQAQAAFALTNGLRSSDKAATLSLYRELEALARAHPDESKLRVEQARAASNLVSDFRSSDLMVARSLCRELEALAKEYPDESKLREEQTNAALLLTYNLQSDELELVHYVYREIESIAKAVPEDKELRVAQSSSASQLINEFRASEMAAARSLYRELEALALAHPDESEIRLEQAQSALGIITDLRSSDMAAARSLARELEVLALMHPDDELVGSVCASAIALVE